MMYKVTFESSGQTHEFAGKKEVSYWIKIAVLHGIKYEYYKSGTDIHLKIYDKEDPLFGKGEV